MNFPNERTRARDTAVRLHGLLSEVRNAPKDARDFALFDRRDALAELGVPHHQIDAFDATDDGALDGHIAQAGAVARALGHVDENDVISGDDGRDVLAGGAGNDSLVGVAGSTGRVTASTPTGLQAGLRGYQTPGGDGAPIHRTPHQRYADEIENSRHNSLVWAAGRRLQRGLMPPAQHAAEARELNEAADRYDALSKSDPPVTPNDHFHEFEGGVAGFFNNPLNVGSLVGGLLMAPEAATVAAGAGLAAPLLRGRVAAGLASLAPAEFAAGMSSGGRRLRDWLNERD
jgi:hypothetical protein